MTTKADALLALCEAASFKPELTPAQALSYVRSLSGDPVSSDAAVEYRRATRYVLRDLAVAMIDTHRFTFDPDKSGRYATMKDAPPIVVLRRLPSQGNGFSMLDGMHRLQAAKDRGDKTIKAYVGER